MSTSYAVVIEKFAERHYISGFKKKYKGAWDVTQDAIVEEFKRIDALLGVTSIAETITSQGDLKICKTEFRVHGTRESRHASGNRCIIAIHCDTATVCVLLVYSKTDITMKNETAAWKEIVKDNYPQYHDLL